MKLMRSPFKKFKIIKYAITSQMKYPFWIEAIVFAICAITSWNGIISTIPTGGMRLSVVPSLAL